MPGSPTPGYLSARVIDSNVGTELVADLAHLHQTVWKVRGLQSGVIGSATLGEFDIPLPAPHSQEGLANKVQYDVLDKGQRIEVYLAGSHDAAPYQSGVITRIDRHLDQPWVIHGVDSLWWLQQSQLFPSEQVGPGGSGASVIQQFSATREVVFDNWANFLAFAAPIVNVTADPQFGLQGISCAFNGIQTAMLSVGTWNAGQQYSLPTHPSGAYASAITMWGTIFADTNASNSGQCGFFFLSDATGANAYFAQTQMTYQGSAAAGWNASVTFYSVAAGVFTQLAQDLTVFTGLQSSVFPFELTVTMWNNTATGYAFRLTLNGKATAANYTNAALVRSSGGLGVRFSANTATNSNYIYRLRFESRTGQYGTPGTWGTNRFQVGSVTTGTAVIPLIASQGQTHLDLIQLAMGLDGFLCLKTPGRGYKADTLTYGALGTDLSSTVRFIEGDNVLERGTTVTGLADMYSTMVRYAAVPGGNSGGTIDWPGPGLPAGGDMVLIDTVTDIGAPDVSLQLANAIAMAARKGNPLTAYQVNILRTQDTSETFHLYDSVQVHIPTLRVNHAKLPVIGWDFKEGQVDQLVYLNQFPLNRLPQQSMQRMLRTTEWLAQHAT